ncbi:type II toxin-antitoxin system RatA family toxin [Rhodospirillum rubrum]|uniref:Cyclase/dehydrase n=1 Tax=Rhodospirillum rubrum (strain ATCC 11170 / ATH 1.1.1 / DSM 467 / LMG 4362 / NCIMB 8255 / S1) TaxID=269796 RepID=Q2RPC2_RHORT|nr:type II toxin-antitoxin system RatA family toxin [Rhodospirillum rubrum]ABC24023.1 cyclase/dehydrase [Rhodospirillum rubrum ATCC 11170]AEO49767.1 cyclase/dehydrase [Rhodospirillum rubrum F11]MBK5955707.1 ubiquinone-binding protein [Rhodospirillum rubrum]QXG79966.1 type II toxin-antitoxin system RatA family toxin [Rhodospirillum rubrum]HCF18159.1 type II toxin-antitoxin system RatA family toxin [Rhodospirillum rubrum]
MSVHHAERFLPFSDLQMFTLVADVERYPQFVPWWIAARVIDSRPAPAGDGPDAKIYRTDQVIGMGPVRLRFTSRTLLVSPRRISVASQGGGPVRDLSLDWWFDAQPGGCLTRLDMTLDLGSRSLENLLAGMSSEAAVKLVDAFERRAHALYQGG